MSIELLIGVLKFYTEEEKKMIKKAYSYADILHAGTFRQSGEPYIIHPLNVACILAELGADCDTICAALLHDTIEDTEITKEDIKRDFNETISDLVDGVSKISRLNFSTKEEQNNANTRKIITSMTKDVRIILIKLADRLHNMRTLQYKKVNKQIENSIETLELYVPMAYWLGCYRIMLELEDLSLKYYKPDDYKRIEELRERCIEEESDFLKEMSNKIEKKLITNNLDTNLKTRVKNICGIYKNEVKGLNIKEVHDLFSIHDLFSLKVSINTTDKYDCYKALGLIHDEYKPINYRFKDYICNPKTNMYMGLHSTVHGDEEKPVQTQVRTIEMDEVASFGIATYWKQQRGNAREKMQELIKNEFQVYTRLSEIDKAFTDNKEFINEVNKELFSEQIYVYNSKGEVIMLPKGSTVAYYANKTGRRDTMDYAKVNDKVVSPDYILKNKDIIKIVTIKQKTKVHKILKNS